MTYFSGHMRTLRWNPPDILDLVVSEQKLSTKIVYIVLQTSVGLF